MIAGEIPDLHSCIDPSSIRVHAPTLVVFICGGPIQKITEPPSSLRDAFMRIALKSPLAKYRLVLAEEVEAFFPTGEYRELLQFESDIAQISELLLLFSESAGSLAELGVFVMDKEVAPRMMVIIDDLNHRRNSFIKLGPLYSLTLHHGEEAVCVLALADIGLTNVTQVQKVNLDALLNALSEPLKTRLAMKREPSTLDPTRNGHVTKLITGLVQHYSALTVNEIHLVLGSMGIAKSIDDIKQHIMCAKVFGWLFEEKRGLKTYYASLASRAAFTFEFAPGVAILDRSRWRSDIREYWRVSDPERFKTISIAAGKAI